MLLHIGLDSWIIQDGNYGDFEIGKEYRFALEFYARELAEASRGPRQPSLQHRGRDLYYACGQIVFRSDSVWAVDFGVPAFQEQAPPDWAEVGTFATGEISVGVDPFFYFESLKNLRGMPDLFRHWHIRAIQLETTPWIETTRAGGGVNLHRDHTRESFRKISRTDAWNDDNGHASYLFECELRQPAA